MVENGERSRIARFVESHKLKLLALLCTFVAGVCAIAFDWIGVRQNEKGFELAAEDVYQPRLTLISRLETDQVEVGGASVMVTLVLANASPWSGSALRLEIETHGAEPCTLDGDEGEDPASFALTGNHLVEFACTVKLESADARLEATVREGDEKLVSESVELLSKPIEIAVDVAEPVLVVAGQSTSFSVGVTNLSEVAPAENVHVEVESLDCGEVELIEPRSRVDIGCRIPALPAVDPDDDQERVKDLIEVSVTARHAERVDERLDVVVQVADCPAFTGPPSRISDLGADVEAASKAIDTTACSDWQLLSGLEARSGDHLLGACPNLSIYQRASGTPEVVVETMEGECADPTVYFVDVQGDPGHDASVKLGRQHVAIIAAALSGDVGFGHRVHEKLGGGRALRCDGDSPWSVTYLPESGDYELTRCD